MIMRITLAVLLCTHLAALAAANEPARLPGAQKSCAGGACHGTAAGCHGGECPPGLKAHLHHKLFGWKARGRTFPGFVPPADCQRQAFRPDVFYNFYVGPGNCPGVPAQMYVAPRPTPPHVGHTYYTYQPLMPHEFLYRHHRVYTRPYNNGQGLSRTTVSWH